MAYSPSQELQVCTTLNLTVSDCSIFWNQVNNPLNATFNGSIVIYNYTTSVTNVVNTTYYINTTVLQAQDCPAPPVVDLNATLAMRQLELNFEIEKLKYAQPPAPIVAPEGSITEAVCNQRVSEALTNNVKPEPPKQGTPTYYYVIGGVAVLAGLWLYRKHQEKNDIPPGYPQPTFNPSVGQQPPRVPVPEPVPRPSHNPVIAPPAPVRKKPKQPDQPQQ